MKTKIALAIIVFLWLITLLYYKTRPGVIVDIKNEMSIPVNNIELEYSGGKFFVDQMSPGTSWHLKVVPLSESDLDILYLNREGKTVKYNVAVYMEPHYFGTINITIKEKDEFEKKVNLITGWFEYLFELQFV